MGRVTITLPAELLCDVDKASENRSAFIVEAVRRELARRRRAAFRRSLENPHEEILEMADAGFDAWSASLPEEDLSGLVDPASLKPVRWVPGKGWAEEKK